MDAASAGILGLIGGVVLGRNWGRIKRGLSWLGDRIKEEAEALTRPIGEGITEYDHTGQLICELVMMPGGYHARCDHYGDPIPNDAPSRLF